MASGSQDPIGNMARKIRALLDKAESSEFAFERDAFVAKAMRLMSEHQITEAMVDNAGQPGTRRGEIIEHSFGIGSGPYVRGRLRLADLVATAQSCRLLTSTDWTQRVVHVIGYESDVRMVEMLYTSLLVQATAEMYRMKQPVGVKTVTARRSFLMGFAERVGERLVAITAEAVTDYEASSGVTGVALVLADRRHEVNDEVRRRYGRIHSLRPTGSQANGEALMAGIAAGDRADLSRGRRVKGPAGSLDRVS